jgi:AraC family transcriptional regulator
MSLHRILIESNFSIECYNHNRSGRELPPRPDFQVIHLIKRPLAKSSTGVSILANPNQPISLPQNLQRNSMMLVRLAPQLLIETAARLRFYRTGAHLIFRQSLTPLPEDWRLHTTLESINSEFENGDAGWREVVGSLINQLAVYLLRTYINVRRSDEIELSRAGIVDRRLRRALEFMHDNCGRELGLSEIASAAYLSDFHFTRLFKKIIGSTPHAYLASLRIERARRLLAETDLSITEVGMQVGYASQSHFTKVFREATGMTPRSFREAIRR